ncbi:conserved protein of unknown function [Methylocaldum szegediense]|uniref:DUF4129 domain-containing protein n=1 Tax=Methylocaldum szegediense TaxID=73780 RepID=A0ABN8X192_9GAMM|nr:conserved protein of unknown function [Methylocaldum szegediense]
MSESELKDLLLYLASDEFRPALMVIAAIVLFLVILLIVYLLLRKKRKRASVADVALAADVTPANPSQASRRETVAETANPVRREVPADPPNVQANTPQAYSPRASVAKPSRPLIPQDSVLRRHFISHVRYMIETITFPRPTDSVLRRHYDQLIASELEACLNDEAHLERLISRYEEHRRKNAKN